jgi:enoyl-CoA hydratase/carnithine racemase
LTVRIAEVNRIHKAAVNWPRILDTEFFQSLRDLSIGGTRDGKCNVMQISNILRIGSWIIDARRAHKVRDQPTVARVNGHALGGGLGLVLACDLAVAVDSAELGTPEIDVGLFPMMVLAWLQRHVGRKRALELILTGDRLKAEDSLRWGLVNRVVPRAELDAATRALASKVAGKSRAILALGKSSFRDAEDMPLPQAMDFLAGQLSLNLGAEDAAEGIAAFLERRPPRWKDR